MINLVFKKVTIHHFLSYDHAEIDLRDKGYCLVRGINRNPRDASKSNGAGKSTAFNAISFALTGETLQGLKSNLGNIYFNDGCYVQLEMSIDNHEYIIMRSKDDKKLGTDLKITVDGQDKSGKTLTESKAILEQLLPDLTSELLGSTTLIGQGMPMRFTANTPSGRKEVLEQLSQSDYMIQDIKDRIAKRQAVLASEIRQYEDDLLQVTTKQNVFSRQLATAQQEYADNYSVIPDFDTKISELTKKRDDIEALKKVAENELAILNSKFTETNNELVKLSDEKSAMVQKFFNEHQEAVAEFNERKMTIKSKMLSLEQEINKLKSIKDVCPTCGQKIPGAVKPDTTEQENLYKEYTNKLLELEAEVKEDTVAYNEVVEKINNKFDSNISACRTSVNSISTAVRTKNEEVLNHARAIEKLNQDILVETNNKQFFETNKNKVLQNINELQGNLEALAVDSKKLSDTKALADEHNAVISKMNTIVKRDFRGFLLKGIIEYIDAKAKEYASKIFGCDDIKFVLEGNNINISFCDKDLSNLSGGEQQRVNLIIQFAIRDFMCQYLQFSSNILVLDEITDALDSESCDRVVNFITDELKDIESVFIISHHDDELQLPVDSELVIEKNELGVSNVIQ